MAVLFQDSQNQQHTFATLEEAISASRSTSGQSTKKIILGAGDHFVNNTIHLTQQDKGLTIEAEKGGKATIYGGIAVENWQQKDAKCWSAPIPKLTSQSADFRMLLVNDRMAQRSRIPETGYLLHSTDFDVLWKSTIEGGWERPATDNELLTLKYNPDDVGAWFDANNAELTIFHMWDESLVGVDQFDPEHHLIRFSNKPGYPPGAFAKQYSMERRYVIWNLKEGLHRPGQWYLDRTAGEVVYWPLPDENMSAAKVIAPTVENIISVRGTKDNPVQNLTLQGFRLSTTNAPLMTGAFGAKLFDGAISIHHADNCVIKDLTIQNVGAHAIKASGNNLTIENCEIKYTGAGAIRYVGSDSLIQNNHIHHVGQVFPSAIALYVGVTDPNVSEEWENGKDHKNVRILHNELHDTPYTAIAAGGKNHRIEYNEIYRAMQDLYDGAGIYITFCENIVVQNNIIRDIKESPGAGTSAYYLDEHSAHCLVQKNISINVARPMHNHISKHNTISNNIFIINGAGRYTVERSTDYVFTHNIIISEEDFSLLDFNSLARFENNIIFSKKGKIIAQDLNKYEIIKTYPLPFGNHNVCSDPKIQILDNGKVEYAKDSAVKELGIIEIDATLAGRLKNKHTIG